MPKKEIMSSLLDLLVGIVINKYITKESIYQEEGETYHRDRVKKRLLLVKGCSYEIG